MEANYSTRNLFLIICAVSCCFALAPSYANGMTTNTNFKVKAVNLGGWLVVEGWIKPTLFDGIPNKDFLDGTGLQFKSVTIGKYLSAEGGGGSILVANRPSASGWETFKLGRIDENSFYLRVFNKQFVGLDTARKVAGNGNGVVATSNTAGRNETFQIVRNNRNASFVRIKASNGRFLQARSEELVTADLEGDANGRGWRSDDPSVFVITIANTLRGEFQLTNGYGRDKAREVLKEHWSTFIVENDFIFMSENGVNAVRIPVGWWIACDPTPPPPYVGGSLEALDNAFSWAQKYNLKVIIDLHAARGSQNGYEHSSSRYGYIHWGSTDDNIEKTVAVINFLTARYVKNPSLYAVELINEPLAAGVPLSTLKKYYAAGYRAVRSHSSTVFVVMSNRIGSINDAKELFPLASNLPGTVVDVHYYNLFADMFNHMTTQQNIDYVTTHRSAELSSITASNGWPLTFVGEWVADWQVRDATKEDYIKFAEAQLEVFGRSSFGWAYWTFKIVNNHHWSLEWMIKNGYIKL